MGARGAASKYACGAHKFDQQLATYRTPEVLPAFRGVCCWIFCFATSICLIRLLHLHAASQALPVLVVKEMQRHQKYLEQRMTRLRREALRLIAGDSELDRRFRLMLTTTRSSFLRLSPFGCRWVRKSGFLSLLDTLGNPKK